MPAIGLGCMNLSHAYGNPLPKDEAELVLQKALDLGITHYDSAALYGGGRNESLIGSFLKQHRKDLFIASKCVLYLDGDQRMLDGSPEAIRKSVEGSLQRLETDYVDLMYMHRLDKNVPIEDSVGELVRLKEEGKLLNIGLSEMSAETIRKAAVVHPIAAVQSEYSLWSRNVEIGVLNACREIGAAFIAFSPVGRGFLADMSLDPNKFVAKDIRRNMPRFQEPHFSANRDKFIAEYQIIAEEAGCSAAQLAIAWVLQRGDNIHVIPGTTQPNNLEEDWLAQSISLSDDLLNRLDQLINQTTVSGARYPEAVQAQIDTEDF